MMTTKNDKAVDLVRGLWIQYQKSPVHSNERCSVALDAKKVAH